MISCRLPDAFGLAGAEGVNKLLGRGPDFAEALNYARQAVREAKSSTTADEPIICNVEINCLDARYGAVSGAAFTGVPMVAAVGTGDHAGPHAHHDIADLKAAHAATRNGRAVTLLSSSAFSHGAISGPIGLSARCALVLAAM